MRFQAISIVLVALLATASGAAAQTQADPEAETGFAAKPLVEGRELMIVTANPLASDAGFRVLTAGGSAVDAAIAAQLVLNVVEPQSSGLGGGAFALLWDAEAETLESWDGRETAPMGATSDMFLGTDGEPLGFMEAVAGGTSTGVPGVPRLLAELHAKHGKLPWNELFGDAITLAEEGYEVSPRLAELIKGSEDRLRVDPDAHALFFDANDQPKTVGDPIVNPALAATFRAYAGAGPEAFYAGPVAEAILAAVGAEPRASAMTAEDLAAYRSLERPPVCMVYRTRFEVCGMGPPSSGGATVGQMLGLLDAFPLPDLAPEDPLAAHLFLEASKLAYADRAAYLADSDFVKVPLRGLLDPGYLADRAGLIDPEAASEAKAEAGDPPYREGRLYAPDPSPGAPGTTQITVVDADGMVFSMTSSIETAFGSARMAAGFLLNNQLTDFSFRSERDGKPIANAVAPGKRPRSSMAPTIVFDISEGGRRPVLALGSPGGSRIIEYVALATIAGLDWGMDAAQAAALAHLSQRNGAKAAVEERPDADALAAALEGMGHTVERRAMTSGLHIIAIDKDGRLTGGADPRREGLALGR